MTATQTLSIVENLTILVLHMKRLLMRNKVQTHIAFDTTLEMGPYMITAQEEPQMAHLIGIVTHQGQSGS